MKLTTFFGFLSLFFIINWPKQTLIALCIVFALCFLTLLLSSRKDPSTRPDNKDQE